MKHLCIIILSLCACLGASAQTIADKINASGRAKVTQPALLNARLEAKVVEEAPAENSEAAVVTGGYRIQVFSGNNARTAKNDAENRATLIRENFPEVATYVIYDAPYWRLRAGDYATYEEAAVVLSELKRAFPTFAREMRLVRDRINAR